MSLRRRVAANILSQYGLRALTLLIGFALIPFLTRKLGVEAFGVVVLFESLVQLSEAALAGFRASLSRHAAVAWAQGKVRDFEEYLAAGGRLLLGAGAVFLVLGIWFAFSLPGWMRVPETLREPARVLFALFSLSFALSVPNAMFRAGLYARERFDRLNAALSFAFIFRAAVIWALFTWTPESWRTLGLYGAAHLATSVVRAAAIRIQFDRLFPGSRRRLGGFDRQKAGDIFSFGSYSFLIHAANALHDSFIVFLVNGLWGPAFGALYGVGMKIPGALYLGLKEPAWALEPTATAMIARGEKARLHELVFFYTKAAALVATPLCLIFGFYASVILTAWAGEHFAAAAGVLAWAMAGLLFLLPFSVCDSLPPAHGYVRAPAFVGVAACVLSVALAYGFGAKAGWGLSGVAAAMALVQALYAFGYSVPLSCRLTGISAPAYLWAGFVKPVFTASAFFLAFAGVLSWTNAGPVSLQAFAIVLPFSAAYAACAWFAVLNGREREIVRQFAGKKA